MTADSNATMVSTVGYATLYVASINGDQQLLPTGHTLADKCLHNLISPSAMLKDDIDLYQGAMLSCNGDFISLSNVDIIPLRFDGKTYYLDYFVSKSATNGSIMRFADVVYSSPVNPKANDDAATVSNDSNMISKHLQPLSEMHCDRLNTTTRPIYFCVIDPSQLSHTSLKHCKFGHQLHRWSRGITPQGRLVMAAPCNIVQHAHLVDAKHEHTAEATVASCESNCSDCPSLELTDDESDDDEDMPDDGDNNTFDEDAVLSSYTNFSISDQAMLLDSVKYHINICCDRLFYTISKLTTYKTCRVLAISILPSKEVEDSCPKELCNCLIYWRLNLTDFTYCGFQNLMHNKLSCKITQLLKIHALSPCTLYTDTHHSKNPHRYKTKLTSNLVCKHNHLNTNLFNVLRQASVHCYHTVISIENLVCVWQYMLFVCQLLNVPGWFKCTTDHCMHQCVGEHMFLHKHSIWLLFNDDTDILLRKCDSTCSCMIPGTPFHKWLMCNCVDKHPDQEVLGGGGPKAKLTGLIPHGLFDLIEEYRL